MTIKIYGRTYSDTPTYYTWDAEKKFPMFEETSEHEWEIEASSISEAKKWLLQNHPEQFMGSTITCEQGFACQAVPCIEYGEGNYETTKARIAWAMRMI